MSPTASKGKTNPSKRQAEDGERMKLGLERIIFFSDAVMAIAITLLAINLRIPDIPASQEAQQLPHELALMAPRLFSFMLSFMVIGIYWISHHRNFGYICRYDATLLVLNLLFLFCIALLPFATDTLGRYGDLPLPNVVYTLTAAGVGIAMSVMWYYAAHNRRLVDADMDVKLVHSMMWRVPVASLIFLASIPLAYVNVGLIHLSWWGALLLGMLFLRLWRQR